MTAVTHHNERRLYKVVSESGGSLHGGDLQWSLPNEEPGEWHSVEGRLVLCSNGLHLTWDPALWWQPGCRVFEVEAKEIHRVTDEIDSKVAARSVRLIRELTDEELVAVRIVKFGQHTAKDQRWIAFDSATVEASGSATVRAFDSATVRASDSATVRASGSATVEASGSATVRAFGSATVRASGSATVRAFGSATVRASGSATVEAFRSVTVIAFWGTCTVTTKDDAVFVDRRHTPPVVTVGPQPAAPAAAEV